MEQLPRFFETLKSNNISISQDKIDTFVSAFIELDFRDSIINLSTNKLLTQPIFDQICIAAANDSDRTYQLVGSVINLYYREPKLTQDQISCDQVVSFLCDDLDNYYKNINLLISLNKYGLLTTDQLSAISKEPNKTDRINADPTLSISQWETIIKDPQHVDHTLSSLKMMKDNKQNVHETAAILIRNIHNSENFYEAIRLLATEELNTAFNKQYGSPTLIS